VCNVHSNKHHIGYGHNWSAWYVHLMPMLQLLCITLLLEADSLLGDYPPMPWLLHSFYMHIYLKDLIVTSNVTGTFIEYTDKSLLCCKKVVESWVGRIYIEFTSLSMLLRPFTTSRRKIRNFKRPRNKKAGKQGNSWKVVNKQVCLHLQIY